MLSSAFGKANFTQTGMISPPFLSFAGQDTAWHLP
jgi:hypothetical protein